MTRKTTTRGPVVFAEWVIGGPIIPLRAKKAKPKVKSPSEVITVEVTTDDDNDTDTLHVTYPRSRRCVPDGNMSEGKKVHFDKKHTKSVLKNGGSQVTVKGSDTDSTAAPSSDTSGDETSEASSDAESSTAGKPCCKCSRCIKKRHREEKCTKNTESSADESETPKCDKCGDKAKADEKDKPKEGAKNEAKKDQDGANKKKNDDNTSKKNDKAKDKEKDKYKPDEKSAKDKSDAKADKAVDKKDEKTQEIEGKDKATANAKDDTSKAKEPETLTLPPGKTPNLIAPIRAQVVQTEAVIEGSQDPRPNAFYDAAHNIMRVYYGPVYGNHDNRSLYPRHDPTGLPLNLGMPYPPHHPYFYGFKDGPPAAYPMSGYPPPPPQHPHPPQHQPTDTGSHRGAFSKPASVHDDIAGRSNVVPVSQTTPPKSNPYYNNKRQSKSVFAGSSRHGSPSHTSPPRRPSPVPEPPPEPTTSGWDNNTTPDNGYKVTAGAHDGWPQDTTNGMSSWDNNAQTDNDKTNNNTSGWGNQPEDNVGMPGAWQDTTMAASTGGKIETTW